MNERVVEVPWMLSRLGRPGALLDVGSAGAPYHAELIVNWPGRIVAADTRVFEAPAPIEVEIVNAAQMPAWWTALFDVVTCISTLDHVGLAAYGNLADKNALERVISEIRRVLKPQGRFLVTFPVGRAQITTHPGGGQRVFGLDEVEWYFAGWTRRSITAYRRLNDVYQPAPIEDCRDAEYLGDRAEAVACLELSKEMRNSMRIRYVGSSTVREFGAYRFRHGDIQEVDDVTMVQEMLTQPGVDFVVADDDALALLVGADRAAELALDGMLTPAAYEGRDFREEVGHRTEMG
jgi:SAM-dependent methyltransferase